MAEGIERIKTLSLKEKNLAIKKVAEYLVTRDDMDLKYQDENKDLQKMWNYISGRAKKQAVDGTACIEDKDVYNWAIHYWDELEEDLKKENNTDDKLNKKETKKSQKASSEESSVQKEETNGQKNEQNDNDIVFKWKGRDVTRAQFNSKEYLSW